MLLRMPHGNSSSFARNTTFCYQATLSETIKPSANTSWSTSTTMFELSATDLFRLKPNITLLRFLETEQNLLYNIERRGLEEETWTHLKNFGRQKLRWEFLALWWFDDTPSVTRTRLAALLRTSKLDIPVTAGGVARMVRSLPLGRCSHRTLSHVCKYRTLIFYCQSSYLFHHYFVYLVCSYERKMRFPAPPRLQLLSQPVIVRGLIILSILFRPSITAAWSFQRELPDNTRWYSSQNYCCFQVAFSKASPTTAGLWSALSFGRPEGLDTDGKIPYNPK